jgi:hypothetical protein
MPSVGPSGAGTPGTRASPPLSATAPAGCMPLRSRGDFAGYLPSRHFGVSSEANAVIGVVAGWGRAFRGEYGWRTQFARPLALYRAAHLDREQVDRIARRYGCQVVEGRSELLGLADQRA